MSIHDLYNKKIIYESETCKNFIALRKDIKEITKTFEQKEIVNIECQLIVTYRSTN